MNADTGPIARLAVAISLLTLLGPLDAWAQPRPRWRGSGGWGAGGRYARLYDPRTVETIKGEVLRVDHLTPEKGMSYGVHLSVKTDKETVAVHLGPAWYLDRQDVAIEVYDTVEVTGSRVEIGGAPAIIAAEVRKGDQTLKLRDESGRPVWSGWRRGGGA
jgi:hypothetical protein